MLELDGQRLSLAQIAAVAPGKASVSLSRSSPARKEKAREVVERIVAEAALSMA
jgi:histidine ammonia-lyase